MSRPHNVSSRVSSMKTTILIEMSVKSKDVELSRVWLDFGFDLFIIYIYTHKFPNIWCHPGQCRVVFTPSAGLYSFVVPGVCCLTSFLWTAVFEMFRLEAAWRSLHLSASKARIEPLVSSYFLTFDVTTSTVCAVQLALVEADKNSHSSGFLYFYSLNKIWLMWSPKRYLVK